MSDEKVLTKEIAEQLLADEGVLDLSEFTAIEKSVGAMLAVYKGSEIQLRATALDKDLAASISGYKGERLLIKGGESSMAADVARGLNVYEGELFLSEFSELGATVASEFGTKSSGRLRIWGNEKTLPLSDEEIIALSACPGYELGKEGQKTVRKSLGKPSFCKSTLKQVKALLKEAIEKPCSPEEEEPESEIWRKRSDLFNEAVSLLEEGEATSADLADVFSEQTLKKVAKTMHPDLWQSTAELFSQDRTLSSLLMRAASEVVEKLKYTGGHFENCLAYLMSRDSIAAAQLVRFILEGELPYPLIKYYSAVKMGSKGISHVMASAFCRYRGTLELWNTGLDVEVAKALVQYRGSLLIFAELREVSDEAAALISEYRGWIDLDLNAIPPSAAEIIRNSGIRFRVPSKWSN